MRILAILAVALLWSAAAFAQDSSRPKKVTTVKVTEKALPSTDLYDVAPDGTVLIDWTRVEHSANSDKYLEMRALAQAMLAIRDGRWRAMPQPPR